MAASENTFFDLKALAHLGHNAIVGKCVRVRRPELVRIGDNTIVDDFTYISGGFEIGRFGHVAPNVNLIGARGSIRAGDFVGIAAGCCLYATSSDYLNASLDLPSVPEEFQFGGTTEDVQLGDHVILGAHTVVLPGVVLPEGVATAAHTVLRKRQYEPWTLYGGWEAKPIAPRRHVRLDEAVARIKAATSS
jgi:acetyltransferase-like isoleucine patch superfamily enzyme